MNLENLNKHIIESRNKALEFPNNLKSHDGYKYTVNHDATKFPAALLYGTWSITYIKKLILGNNWIDINEKNEILNFLNKNRLKNGLFFPQALESIKYAKSKEYMQLHCYNYSVGAAYEVDGNYDFQSSYMDAFLNADFLERWLDQRSLQRPWEESNNIVNVASYLALNNDNGNVKGKERLYQMLAWHNKIQNPKTGGFGMFSPSRKNTLQSMAGAVHNFHIHHYLNEPMNYEEKIAKSVIPYLYEGPNTACLSIDFVELACYTLPFLKNPYELEQALLFHLNALLDYQNIDGGWFENESHKKPTTANGMKEDIASSNSYATWFRLCSIGLISITLLGGDKDNWSFRQTLGMGYVNKEKLIVHKPKSLLIDSKITRKFKKKNLPHKLKKDLISLAVKIMR